MSTINTLSVESAVPKSIEPVLTNASTALIILLCGFILGKIANKSIKKVMKEFEIDKYLAKIIKLDVNLTNILATITSTTIYIITIVLALNYVGLTSIIVRILLSIFLISLVGTFMLAAKDFIPNIISNIRYKNKLVKNKKVKIGIVKGTIYRLGLLSFNVKTKEGDNISIPYSYLAQKKVEIN